MKKYITAIILALALTGCAEPNHVPHNGDSPGFWRGMWHGICAPAALVGIMFGWDISIYQADNTGNWYNFGFLLGLGGLSSGSSSSSRRK